jgi:hypothetical protein
VGAILSVSFLRMVPETVRDTDLELQQQRRRVVITSCLQGQSRNHRGQKKMRWLVLRSCQKP